MYNEIKLLLLKYIINKNYTLVFENFYYKIMVQLLITPNIIRLHYLLV